MQVTEVVSDGLKRAFEVRVPAADLQAKAETRLKDMSGRVQLRGFRPGKAPLSHLRRLYGKSVMAEVIQETINKSSDDLLSERDLSPAYQPEIDVAGEENEINDVIAGKTDLAYKMTFEILPEIALKDFSAISLEQWVAKPSDETVEARLKAIAEANIDFAPRPEDGEAQQNDRLTISFTGRIDGQPFEGGSGHDIKLQLGSGAFLPGFEDQLAGARVGETRMVEATFPDGYQVASLAGKQAVFETSVSLIEAPLEAKVDDALAQRLELKDLAELRQRVTEGEQGNLQQITQMKLKRDLFDVLEKDYQFDLPAKLVEGEFDQIWTAFLREREQEKRPFSDKADEEKARADYQAIAARRVRIGLLLNKIGETEGITVEQQELEAALMQRARQTPGAEKYVLDYYKNNPDALLSMRNQIFEQKIVDYLFGKIQLDDREVSESDLMAVAESDETGEDPEIKSDSPAAGESDPSDSLSSENDEEGQQ